MQRQLVFAAFSVPAPHYLAQERERAAVTEDDNVHFVQMFAMSAE